MSSDRVRAPPLDLTAPPPTQLRKRHHTYLRSVEEETLYTQSILTNATPEQLQMALLQALEEGYKHTSFEALFEHPEATLPLLFLCAEKVCSNTCSFLRCPFALYVVNAHNACFDSHELSY